MKFIHMTLAALLLLTVSATAQNKKPMASPAASVSTTVGFTNISISYFRPQMKGRKIFGNGDSYLVPFGKTWRTGANGGTKVTFSDDVTIGGKSLKAGEYQLVTTPGKDSWDVIFCSDTTIGGNMSKVNDGNTALKLSVSPDKLKDTVDALTINIANISTDSKSADIQLAWENTSVNIPVAVSLN